MPVTVKTVPEDQVPEVVQFQEAKRNYEEYKEQNAPIVDTLEHLQAEYNRALEAAEKVVRSKQINSGEFQVISQSVTYDWDKLVEEIGVEDFRKMGGTLTTTTEFEIDKRVFEAQIAAGRIPASVVEKVGKTVLRYKKPDKVSL